MTYRWLGPLLLVALAVTPTLSTGQETDVAELLRTAEAHRKAGRYLQAIDVYEEALRLAPASGDAELEWQARTFLALSYELAGDPRRSVELREQNLAFARARLPARGPMNRVADSLLVLANGYASLRDYERTAQVLVEALALDEGTDPDSLSHRRPRLLLKLGVAQFSSGDVAEAERTLAKALATADAVFAARSAGGMPPAAEYEFQIEIIRWLQKVLIAVNRTEEALVLAERRSQALVSLLARETRARPASTPTLEEMKRVAHAQQSTLVVYSVIYEHDPDLPLEFSDYTKIPVTDFMIWVVKPTGEVAFRRSKLETPLMLAERVRSVRHSIGAFGRGIAIARVRKDHPDEQGRSEARLRWLHRLLIEPIADLLPADPDAHVTLVLQDMLFLVPFAALQDAGGRSLVERHTLVTAPSIQLVALTRDRQQQLPAVSGGALVVGNPNMPTLHGQPLPPLPGAEAEAKEIAALLKTSALVGQQATKRVAMARMSHARVIHLATHGVLDDVGGAFSSVALAPEGGDDGFLTAREMVALQLDAELVVLSACDTGGGKITGDGVVGLSRALFGAGASSVLVSLWAVPDAPTASLMRAFYGAVARGADKARALRQAMLSTMAEHPNPADWAGFMLIGDPRVSTILAAGITQGMGDGGGDRPATAATRYYVIPVPVDAERYEEWPSRFGEAQVDISFDTSLSLEALMTFYRGRLSQDGFTEHEALTQRGATGFQMVFRRAAKQRKLVLGGNEGTNRRTVIARFE